MRNPLENEETAFRFVLGTIAYFVPIVIASWIATWLGVIVFFLASGVVVALIRRGTQSPPTEPRSGRAQVEDTPVETDDRR
jgi:membrane protein implicated in regulation of membrane protease activity